MKFEDIIDKIALIDEERGWSDSQIGDLAKSIMLESAELLEHFQWDDTLKYRGVPTKEKNKLEIGKEMADIFIYLIKISEKMNINLLDVTSKKLDEIRIRSKEHTPPPSTP